LGWCPWSSSPDEAQLARSALCHKLAHNNRFINMHIHTYKICYHSSRSINAINIHNNFQLCITAHIHMYCHSWQCHWHVITYHATGFEKTLHTVGTHSTALYTNKASINRRHNTTWHFICCTKKQMKVQRTICTWSDASSCHTYLHVQPSSCLLYMQHQRNVGTPGNVGCRV
jgi:hypothetical protein